eukprot:508814_1
MKRKDDDYKGFKVVSATEFEVLGINMDPNEYRKQLISKITKCIEKLRLIDKIDDHYRRSKLLSHCLKAENIIYLLSNARTVVMNDAEIIKAIDQLHAKMMNTLLACSTNQMSSKINNLPGSLGGGGATCNITKLTSTTPLSSWHQSVIPILQHLARAGHEEVYQCLDNEYKKYERHLEIFNEGLEAEHKLQEIKNTNLIKLMNCSDYGAEILRNQNKTDPRFRLKSMTKRLSLNQYIAILSDDMIDTAIKSRIIANRSLKASSWLKPIYGWQDSEIYNMSNLEYKVNIKMMHGVPLMKEEQPCPDCNMMMSIFGTHGLVCTHG